MIVQFTEPPAGSTLISDTDAESVELSAPKTELLLRQRFVSGLRSWPSAQGFKPELAVVEERQRFVSGFLVWPGPHGVSWLPVDPTLLQWFVSGLRNSSSAQGVSCETADSTFLQRFVSGFLNLPAGHGAVTLVTPLISLIAGIRYGLFAAAGVI